VLFPGDRWGLASSEVTIARALSERGYATQAIGKWHCGDQPDFLPTNHGFDHFFGLPYSNDMGRQVGEIQEGDRERIKTPPLPLMSDAEVLEQQPDQASLTARYVNEAVRFMRLPGTAHSFSISLMSTFICLCTFSRDSQPALKTASMAPPWKLSIGLQM